MSIESNAFGRVVLTKKDAEKFERQVTYGRPSAQAIASVERGAKYAERLKKDGRVVFRLKPPA